jgi:uncharacterized protein DUF2442
MTDEAVGVSGASDVVGVTSVRVLARYWMELGFDNGETRVIDVEDLLNGPAFAPLRDDYTAFCAVRVDPELGTVVWPGEVDLAPEVLYRQSKPSQPD